MVIDQILSTIKKLKKKLTRRKPLIFSFKTDEPPFEYSSEWYDNAYHLGRLNLKERNFYEINKMYEESGYRIRLENVLRKIKVDKKKSIKWLEIGCHLGLTSYWITEKYPNTTIYMFDFSKESINWCMKNFPNIERAVIWQGNVEKIFFGNQTFDNEFDYVTCIDVTEHLPEKIYKNMIYEIHRVIKPDGLLILMQGNTPNVEHIHILEEKELVKDFVNCGFSLIKKLPHRHYLFKKNNY